MSLAYACSLRVVEGWSAQPLLQRCAHLQQRRADAGQLADRIQQAPIVDQAVVANMGYLDPGRVQLPRVGFTFDAQHIVLCDLDQRWGQALELLDRGPQR